MPRTSEKQQVIKRVEDLLSATSKKATVKKLCGVPTDVEESLIFKLRDLKLSLKNKRYLSRGSCRRKKPKFHLCLSTDIDDPLNDTEFKHHFRVSRECFWELVALIADFPRFHRNSSDTRGRVPKPAEHQLLVLLKYLGTEGNAACSLSLGKFFGVGSGIIDECRKNALEAILLLEDRTYFWPTTEERSAISNRIKEDYLFPDCVGLIDGTLLPLATRPLIHGETYLSRKRPYAIVMLVVCDDQGRILYYHVGWPGSVHDNRAWRNCRLFKKCFEYFSPGQCPLGDSAFTASQILIPPFKCAPGKSLDSNKTAFNTLLAKPRVKSEHCIGVMKGRFPFMKQIRLRLAGKSDMKRIVDCTRAVVALHNFLIGDDIDADWITQEDNEEQSSETVEIRTPSNTADYTRRNELIYCLSELQETNII